MLRTSLFVILLFTLYTNHADAQNLENLKEINQVWDKFYKAFETQDYSLMADIHSEKLIRISGGQSIIDYDTYISNYEVGFKRDVNNKDTSTISLRFFERINNNSTASERGIYKLIRNQGKANEKMYYGQFHVILTKDNGIWKITMDYDSSEFDTIGEDDYQKAHAIDDYGKFIKQ